MSTISDALRKVQQQRASTGGRSEPAAAPPNPPPGPAAPPSPPPPSFRREHEPPRQRPDISAVMTILAVGMVVVMVIYFWKARTGGAGAAAPEDRTPAVAGSPSSATAIQPAVPVAAVQPAPVAVRAVKNQDTVAVEVPLSAPPAKTEPPVPTAVPTAAPVPVAADVAAPGASGGPAVAPVPTPIATASPAPLSPPRTSRPVPADLPVLNGTLYSARNPVAIINGSALKEGEMVGGYEVVRIQPTTVTVRSNGREYVLRLK